MIRIILDKKILFIFLISLPISQLPDAYSTHHVIEILYFEVNSGTGASFHGRGFGINHCNIGDIIKWSFRTYNQSFEVWTRYIVGWTVEVLTREAYSGSGYILVNEVETPYNSVYFSFVNVDSIPGYIRIEVEVITWKIILYSTVAICSLILISGIIIVLRRRKARIKRNNIIEKKKEDLRFE